MKVYFMGHAMVTTSGWPFNRNSDCVCCFTNLEGENLNWNFVVCSETI